MGNCGNNGAASVINNTHICFPVLDMLHACGFIMTTTTRLYSNETKWYVRFFIYTKEVIWMQYYVNRFNKI